MNCPRAGHNCARPEFQPHFLLFLEIARTLLHLGTNNAWGIDALARDFAMKLRLAAVVLGCTTRKELAAAFCAVNRHSPDSAGSKGVMLSIGERNRKQAAACCVSFGSLSVFQSGVLPMAGPRGPRLYYCAASSKPPRARRGPGRRRARYFLGLAPFLRRRPATCGRSWTHLACWVVIDRSSRCSCRERW